MRREISIWSVIVQNNFRIHGIAQAFFIAVPSIYHAADRGYTEYRRREYCNDVKCPIQLLLNREVEKSPRYEEIRAICASSCIHSTHAFHRWLTEKGYRIVRPAQE